MNNLNLKKGFQDISSEIKKIKDLIEEDDFELGPKEREFQLKTPSSSSEYVPVEVENERIDQLRRIIILLGGFLPIYVSHDFEISNGLRGFSLSAVAKLLAKVQPDDSFRAIIGICEENYEWTKQKFFRNLRLIIGLPFKPLQPVSLQISISKTTASFLKDKIYHTLFLEPKIDTGILILTVRVDHIGGNFCFIGVADAKTVGKVNDHWVGGIQGGACYYSDREYVCLYTKYHRSPFIEDSFKVNDGDILSAEVDMNKHVVVFFHNGQILPYYVSGLPEEVHFGYSATRLGGVSITFQSLCRSKGIVESGDVPSKAVPWSS